jgi:hypothetical protein
MLPGQSRCAQLHQVHLIATLVCSIVHACAQAHSTAQYSHGAAMKVMVLGLCGDLGCMWHALDLDLLGSSTDVLEHITLGSIVASVHSSTLTGTKSSFWLIPPFKPHFYGNDLQHNKTLKLTKTLENNITKSLTNISIRVSNI